MPAPQQKDTVDDKALLTHLPEKLPVPNAYAGSFFKRDTRNFHHMEHDEPHATRRRLILAKHPEVKELMKHDPISVLFAIGFVTGQFFMMWVMQDKPWWLVILAAYVSGATLSHSLFVLIHDLTHYTAFRSRFANQATAMFCNFGQGFPTAISFGRYHADHHIFQGRPNWDPDLPTLNEVRFFNTMPRKLFYLIFMPFFYSLRPYFVCPKKPSPLELLNLAVCVVWDLFLFNLFGAKSITYLLVGTLFGLGISPVAAHIIAEHYEFIKGQDTYSYYGPMNWISLNIGYHIEHHDFPNIPWRLLPKLKAMAPEFYDTLPYHNSYVMCMVKFVFDKDFGSWCRITRTHGDEHVRLKKN